MIEYRKAVDEIIDDLKGRGGLCHVWDQIDEDIQEEIKEEWAEILNKNCPAGA